MRFGTLFTITMNPYLFRTTPKGYAAYNPIVGRACAGRLFDSLDTVVELMRKAATATGLKTTVNVMRRSYLTGRNATAEMRRNLKTVFDEHLPKWNYRAIPDKLTVVD